MPLSYDEIIAMPSGPDKNLALAEWMDAQSRGAGAILEPTSIVEPPLEVTPIVPTPTAEFFKYEDIIQMKDPEQQKAEMAKRIAKSKGWDMTRAMEAAEEWQKKYMKVVAEPSITGEPKYVSRGVPPEKRGLRKRTPGEGGIVPKAPPAQAGMERAGVGGRVSGVRDPGKLTRLGTQLEEERMAAGERAAQYLAPYETLQSEFAKLTPEQKEMLGVTDISAAAPTPQEEYAAIAAKPIKSAAELARMQELAVDISAQTGKEKAQEELGYMEEMEGQLRAKELEAEKKQMIRQAMMEDEMGKLEDAQKTYASAEIDPMKHFKDPGKAVMSFIGLALGALGQYFQSQHGRQAMPNMAILAFNKAIDQNIDAQKAEIAKLGKAVDMRYNAVAMMRNLFKDEALADDAAKLALTQMLGRQIDITAAKYKGREIEERAMQAKALLAQQHEQLMFDFQLKLDTQNLRKMELEERAAAHAQTMRLGWAQLMASRGKKPREMTEKTAIELGLWEKAHEGVLALGDAHRVLKGQSAYMPDVVMQYFPDFIAATNATNYDKLVRPLIADIIRSFSGAQVTDKEREWFMQMLPKASDTLDTGRKNIEAMINFIQRKHSGMLGGMQKIGISTGMFQPMKTTKWSGKGEPTY